MVSKQEIKVTQDTFVVWLRRRNLPAAHNFPVKNLEKQQDVTCLIVPIV